MKKQQRKKGFTLVELAIVIAVIAVLAAILVPTLTTVLGKANKQKTEKQISNAVTAYMLERIDAGEDVSDIFDEVWLVSGTGDNAKYYRVVNGVCDAQKDGAQPATTQPADRSGYTWTQYKVGETPSEVKITADKVEYTVWYFAVTPATD